MAEVTMVVSAGHGEYGGALPEGLGEVLWNPHDHEEIWDGDMEASEETAQRLYSETTGLEPLADTDLSWEIVYRLAGEREAVSDWLNGLLAELGDEPQGGDDDTYDYWPSGVRLAVAVADALGEGDATRAGFRQGLRDAGWDLDELGLGWL